VQVYNATSIAGTEVERPRFDMSPERVIERKVKAEKICGLSVKSLSLESSLDQKSAKELVRGFLPITNISDGRTARFPVESVGKILRNNEFDISQIIRDIPRLYETSILIWSELEFQQIGHKPHPNISEYYHYINKFSDGSNEYYIRFTVPEERAGRTGGNGRSFIHSAIISDTTVYNKKGDGSQQARVILPGEKSLSPFVDKRLREFFDATINKITQSDSKVNT